MPALNFLPLPRVSHPKPPGQTDGLPTLPGPCPTTLPTMIDALLDAAHDPTFAAQLNAAELRVTQAKATAGLLPCQTPGK